MPSSLNLNGLRVFRPAVYAEVDASSLGGQNPSTGSLCIVGAFPQFEQNEALTFTSASALVSYDASDSELALLGKIAFSPSLDDRIPAGVASLTMLNVQECTQASLMLLDEDGNNALQVKSKVWGARGNRCLIAVENENTDQCKITVSRDGIEEVFEGIESGDLASVYYSGSLLDACSINATRSSVAFSWEQAEAVENGALSMDVSDMASSSTLAISLSEVDHTNTVFVVLTGSDLSGASVTETLTFASGDGAEQTSANSYSVIESIEVATDDLVYTGNVEVSGQVAFDPSDYSNLNELISAIDALSGFTASYDAGESYPANEIDAVSDSILGVNNSVNLRADLYAVIQALRVSKLVSVERANNGTKRLAQSDGGASISQRLTGGGASTVVLDDWTSALQTIEASDLQIIVPWSTSINELKEVKKHLVNSAIAGRERNAWMGASANQSISAIKGTYSKVLNDRNIAIVGQSIKYVAPNGETKTLAPLYLALMLAGMQAGSSVGTPLTRKRPDVLDVVSPWDANRDATDAIKAGIVNLSFGAFGYQVERSVTTYLTDDNPIYSEVSANESVNASIRDLRSGLDRFIGEANRSLTANRIKSIAEARLNRQVLDGVIKGYRDVILADEGDTLVISYTVAPVEPLNFIRISATIQRF
jgi:hypothetical protein